jgi:hypothetical protein
VRDADDGGEVDDVLVVVVEAGEGVRCEEVSLDQAGGA